jgi:hypothetical protein
MALLRLAEHGARAEAELLALAASAGAWAMCRAVDPVSGAGQALRLLVKALRRRQAYAVALLAAWVRVDVAGAHQPNAAEVLDYWRNKAPRAEVSALEALTPEQRVERLERRIVQLGAVNPLAKEAYEEAKAEVVDIAEQIADLEASVVELRRLVRELGESAAQVDVDGESHASAPSWRRITNDSK